MKPEAETVRHIFRGYVKLASINRPQWSTCCKRGIVTQGAALKTGRK